MGLSIWMSYYSVWDKKSQENIPKLMEFMSNFGLITGRDPKGKYHPLTDVIHKVLNDLTVDDWAIIIGEIPTLECQKELLLVLTQEQLLLH